MIPAKEMPDDNADLASLSPEFARLDDDSPASCPAPISELLDYLIDEAPGGERLSASDLAFQRTALVESTRYWIWVSCEPDGGDRAYLTVADTGTSHTVGYESDYYGLTPEQFILGDYHQVF